MNILNNVSFPVVMLTTDLRIRGFSPLAEKILNLIPSDTGRPLSDLKVEVAKTAYCRRFDTSARESEGRHFFSLGNGRWNLPALRERVEKIIPLDAPVEEFSFELEVPHQGRRHFLLTGKRAQWSEGLEHIVISIAEAKRG